VTFDLNRKLSRKSQTIRVTNLLTVLKCQRFPEFRPGINRPVARSPWMWIHHTMWNTPPFLIYASNFRILSGSWGRSLIWLGSLFQKDSVGNGKIESQTADRKEWSGNSIYPCFSCLVDIRCHLLLCWSLYPQSNNTSRRITRCHSAWWRLANGSVCGFGSSNSFVVYFFPFHAPSIECRFRNSEQWQWSCTNSRNLASSDTDFPGLVKKSKRRTWCTS
jgi:hypothetical protein